MSGKMIWNLKMADGTHTLQFQHNTLTGRRFISLDGATILKTVGRPLFRFRLEALVP